MIDIHTHILPSLDDGAKDLDESIAMVKLELEQGVDTIIATPHLSKGNYTTSVKSIEKAYYTLQESLEKLNIKVKVLLGQEINVTSNIFNILQKEKFFTLANTKYILIELNNDALAYDLENIIYEIKLLGYKPILAHVEYYVKLFESKELLKSIMDEGVHLQINTSSVLSYNNDKRTEFCKYLLRNKLVTFVATDAHDTIYRKPNLFECYKFVNLQYDEEYANDLFLYNARKMLNNEDIKYEVFPLKKSWRR